ncbi:MAG: hypothetical protein AAGI48_03885 [Verrucomicrobiota bacterium]
MLRPCVFFHPDSWLLIPTILIEDLEGEGCGEGSWALSVQFLAWGAGICWVTNEEGFEG